MRHHDQLKLGTTTTLDEPVLETLKRDLDQVVSKLKVVLLPLGDDSRDTVIQRLRDWDLWGPLLVCILLSTILSITAPGETASMVFAAVFVIVWFGAAAVTVNAQLLGGTISFFQSIIIKSVFVAVGFIWSTRASVVFMQQVIKEERRLLAVFPVFFFYTFISWMVLLQ